MSQSREQPRTSLGREIYTGHTLSYLNASWDPLGAPGADFQTDVDGCWRHTFALTGVGAAGNAHYYGVGLPYGAVSVNVPSSDADLSHLDRTDAAAATPSATGVSARRSPSLYNFVERHTLEQHLEDRGITAVDVADPGSAGALHDDLFRSREFLDQHSDVEHSVSISAIATALGLVPNAADDASAGLKAFASAASAGEIGLNALLAALEYYDAFTVEEPPRFDRGFAATFPTELYQRDGESVTWPDGSADASSNFEARVDGRANGAYFGAGAHYLLFDVLEVPSDDHASVVDVASSFDRLPEGQTTGPVAGWSIVLDTPVPPGGDSTEVSTADRFSAEAVETARPSRRAPRYEVNN